MDTERTPILSQLLAEHGTIADELAADIEALSAAGDERDTPPCGATVHLPG
ncbi:hypothetical protein [Prauserella shujinwangii]|uniref:hypothetical protein n=1 Tax=Prauserella shujinwangii TaxID=1453103 RepID=UPI0015E605F0|nr:hypothetical protein [Prauserella shujinwangii]